VRDAVVLINFISLKRRAKLPTVLKLLDLDRVSKKDFQEVHKKWQNVKFVKKPALRGIG
jgi:hypothetical protein